MVLHTEHYTDFSFSIQVQIAKHTKLIETLINTCRETKMKRAYIYYCKLIETLMPTCSDRNALTSSTCETNKLVGAQSQAHQMYS